MAMSIDEMIQRGFLNRALRKAQQDYHSDSQNPSTLQNLVLVQMYLGDLPAIEEILDPRWPDQDLWTQRIRLEYAYMNEEFQAWEGSPAYVQQRIDQARRYFYEGQDDALDELLDQEEQWPHLSGFVDGRAFDGIRDCDDLRAPILEVYRDHRYLWLALEQIRTLRLHPPRNSWEKLYQPATVRLQEGVAQEIIIPVRYARTSEVGRMSLMALKETDFGEESGLMVGLGRRQFLIGEEELTLGEFQQLEFRS